MNERKVLKMDEDKARICELLLPAVQATRGGQNVISLTYGEDQYGHEIVVIREKNGNHFYADVSMDSGTAMIRDICQALQ